MFYLSYMMIHFRLHAVPNSIKLALLITFGMVLASTAVFFIPIVFLVWWIRMGAVVMGMKLITELTTAS